MKNLVFGLVAVFAASAVATPAVTSVSVSAGEDGIVFVSYSLADAPAVVTFDVRTNGVSIGGAAFGCVTGEVNQLVTSSGTHSFVWNSLVGTAPVAAQDVLDGGAKVVVTAWSPDAPPDYLVVDLTSGTNFWFYESEEALPGGLLANPVYRTTMLVMKYVAAKDVTWSGLSASDSKCHDITLESDYYIGVFELTQSQWFIFNKSTTPNFGAPAAMRPMEKLAYNPIRNGSVSGTAANSAYFYPEAPSPDSYLGLLRARTGIAFDLPSEAQWEYACRAGTNNSHWNDGTSTSTRCPGRTKEDGQETAEVGSYPRSKWGTYDMHGNVYEWCLDWFQEYPSGGWTGGDKGVVNANGAKTINGTNGVNRVRRGGCFAFNSGTNEMSGQRDHYPPATSGRFNGCRLVCPARPYLFNIE